MEQQLEANEKRLKRVTKKKEKKTHTHTQSSSSLFLVNVNVSWGASVSQAVVSKPPDVVSSFETRESESFFFTRNLSLTQPTSGDFFVQSEIAPYFQWFKLKDPIIPYIYSKIPNVLYDSSFLLEGNKFSGALESEIRIKIIILLKKRKAPLKAVVV